ncbi:MAG: DUF5677 domain-containing protein [Candidatus Eremiobacteraeota bacterium]|nr:DUF5677 domain-containing protein [Candidatus Eremiobacteraeota bacterium]
MDLNEKARNVIPVLVTFSKNLIQLARDVIEESGKKGFKDDNHIGFMSFAFLCRQIENLESMLCLVKVKKFKSAAIIARSSLEGTALLLWAANKPQKRAYKWRCFVVLEDYWRFKEMLEKNEKIDKKDFDEIESAFIEIGHLFLTKKAKTKMAKTKKETIDPDSILENDFHKNWYDGKKISDIFEEVKGGDREILYKYHYKRISNIIHWNPSGLATSIETNEDRIQFTSKKCFNFGALALSCGFQSLIQTLSVYNMSLNLAFEKKIEELNEQYILAVYELYGLTEEEIEIVEESQ